MNHGARVAWIIDDEPALHPLVGRLLQQLGLTPLSFFDGADVLAHLEKRRNVAAIALERSEGGVAVAS